MPVESVAPTQEIQVMIKPRYRQLTPVQRYQIQALLEAGNSQAAIARQLKCHAATISRELSRCPSASYQAESAQVTSDERRRGAHKASKLSKATLGTIKRCLERHLSPEMVANRMTLEAGEAVLSTATIYRWIARDWQQGGSLCRHLQRAYKSHRTRYGVPDRRKRLSQRRSIHERPKIVETRTRRGDWEGDTMYGKGGHLVTLVDRCSRYFNVRKVAKRTKKLTADRITDMLRNHPAHTLTLDNGVEFASHKDIEKRTGATVYFADAYASWQRGTNENTNGRLRRFIPRSTDLSKLSPQALRRIVEKLNMQPRKCLGWKTPYEVHYDVSVALIM